MNDRVLAFKTRVKRFFRSRRKGQMLRSRVTWELLRIKQSLAHRQGRTLILIAGPESTGTRIFTEILSAHPQVLGTPDASKHGDVLDAVWEHLEKEELVEAARALAALGEAPVVVTRRSIPHATGDTLAHFMTFPRLDALFALCQALDMALVVLITTRSTAANLASWTVQRASAANNLGKAKVQYEAAYRLLFEFLVTHDVPFFFLSLEALVLDREAYVQSVFQLLGLPPHDQPLELRANPNARRYEWYASRKDGALT